jgi:DNA ligase-associated metallophosphoesterase
MAAPLHHTIQNNTFWVLPQRALYWEEQKAIIVSDLHLGKTGHFRKEGIAVPQAVYKDDLHRLFHIIQYYKPEQLIIAGDMFHSRMNKEVDLFTRWRNDVSHLHIQLIKGNHDILLDGHYSAAAITISHKFLHVGKFCFVHDIADVGKSESREGGRAVHSPSSVVHGKKTANVNRESSIENRENLQSEIANRKLEPSNEHPVTSDPLYYFSGHMHPGIVLQTGSRQSMRFPCYYFTADYAVLPAFSAFSGMYSVSPKKTERVFAIVNGAVMKFGK